MPREIKVRYSMSRRADPPDGLAQPELPAFAQPVDDVEFYLKLPNCVTEETYIPRRGYSWGEWGTIATTGTAVIGSTAFASLLKAWLASRRRKVKISNGKRSITYEGPNFEKDLPSIEAALEDLADEAVEL